MSGSRKKGNGMMRLNFISFASCFLALFFQAVIPSLHLYCEALEKIDQAALKDGYSLTGVLHAPFPEAHDETKCPICQALVFHHLSGTLTLAFSLEIAPAPFLGTLPFLENGFAILPEIAHSGRAPPSFSA